MERGVKVKRDVEKGAGKGRFGHAMTEEINRILLYGGSDFSLKMEKYDLEELNLFNNKYQIHSIMTNNASPPSRLHHSFFKVNPFFYFLLFVVSSLSEHNLV